MKKTNKSNKVKKKPDSTKKLKKVSKKDAKKIKGGRCNGDHRGWGHWVPQAYC